MREDTLSRDQETLRFIRIYFNKHGYPPTRREISEFLGFTSTRIAQRVIERLERDGFIETTRVARGIKIKGANTKARTEDV